MHRNPVWLLTAEGLPVRMEHEDEWQYREPLTAKMIFTQYRHRIDISKSTQIQLIAPYHFKGRPVLTHLLGVTIGILVAGIMDLEPLTSAFVVLTFAISTLLFGRTVNSGYWLIRCEHEKNPAQCIIINQEDLPIINKSMPETIIQPENVAPSFLNDDEKDRVELLRYSVVTVLSSISVIAMADTLNRVTSGEEGLAVSITAPIVIATAAVLAVAGIIRIIVASIKIKNKASKPTL